MSDQQFPFNSTSAPVPTSPAAPSTFFYVQGVFFLAIGVAYCFAGAKISKYLNFAMVNTLAGVVIYQILCALEVGTIIAFILGCLMGGAGGFLMYYFRLSVEVVVICAQIGLVIGWALYSIVVSWWIDLQFGS